MPLRIELENLWNRLSTRFKARREGEVDEGYPVLLDTLQPVTNFDELAKEWNAEKVGDFTRLAAAGAGTVIAYTIPDGKRLSIRAFAIVRTAGDGTISAIYVRDTADILCAIQTAGANFQPGLLTQDIIADEGMIIAVEVAAISTDSTWDVRFYYIDEDAF